MEGAFTKCWIVWSDFEEGQSIVAVFDNEESAFDCARFHNKNATIDVNYSVQEWDIMDKFEMEA